ncbi:ParB/RepB/Spo0J family partition protein [Streptomyces sp. NPDC047070]|uniref:ParB/RepB/Spo0J family partition protein n=1 Tax=Streptomyces sp. NPDC047070 TaxID=3154923 RepID=UPI0034550EDE
MADITITHTRAEGTLLDGSRKGDGIFEIVRQHGFWFSRSLGCLYVKHSRDKAADTWKINRAAEALREAGHEVTVEVKERVRRSFAEAEADREGRAEDRADRYGERAGKAASSSAARRDAAHAISERFEFGQPILVGHHSERGARRDQERIHTNMRKSIEEDKKSGYWSDRARAAEGYEAFRKDPHRTLRRLERLRADLRRQERDAQGGQPSERQQMNMLDLREEIEHWEQLVKQAEADGVKIWRPEDFAPGDYVWYSRSWHQVKRVNPKTLSIAWNLRLAPKQVMTLEDATERGQTWTHPADYTQVSARCPEKAMDAFLADGKVPGTKAAAEASRAQPASAVREAKAAKPKKAGTTKRSDPKVARRIFVKCEMGGKKADLTWLNGGNRPHKDFEPVEIVPEEGATFNKAVWSAPLQEQIGRLLAERGYRCTGGDWTLSRDRTGFVRDIEQIPEQPPAAAPAIEETHAPEAAAGEALQGHGGTQADAEKTAPTCENSGDTRNATADSRVGHSDHPLTSTPEEDAMTEEERYGRKLTPRERKVAEVAEMQERAAEQPEIERTAELDTAYGRYVDDGIAATDGRYIPLDFQAWASTLGASLVTAATPEGAAEVEEPPAIEGTPAAPKAPEKTALTCENSESTRNHTADSRVGISDYPLNPITPEEAAMTTKTAPAPKKAPAKKTAPKKAAPKKAAPKATAPAEVKTVQKVVPIDRIDRDPSQPRTVFDQAKLEELAGSIKELGLLQPVSLRYVPATKRYVLIAGERRWRSSKLAGLTEMPAIVSHGVQEGDRETLARQIAENVGREDMTPVEEAESFKRLTDAEYSIDEVSKMVGKSPAYVGWRIDLLRLCEPAREALAKGHLTVGLAWYVSLLNCDNQMRFLVRHTRGEFKSTRDAEAFAQAARTEEKRQEQQGSFFVLADEAATSTSGGQDALPGSLDVPEEERERITADRSKLVGRIDKLGVAGEILSALATADPQELALLLGGTPGGVPGHQLRIEHLRELTLKATKNLREAQAIAAVRAGSIAINPEAAALTAAA